MVLLSIFFYTNQIHGEDHQQIVLYSFCRSGQALFIWQLRNITSNLFLYEDLSTLTLHTSVGCISSECQQDRTDTCVILLSENIPNI